MCTYVTTKKRCSNRSAARVDSVTNFNPPLLLTASESQTVSTTAPQGAVLQRGTPAINRVFLPPYLYDDIQSAAVSPSSLSNLSVELEIINEAATQVEGGFHPYIDSPPSYHQLFGPNTQASRAAIA